MMGKVGEADLAKALADLQGLQAENARLARALHLLRLERDDRLRAQARGQAVQA